MDSKCYKIRVGEFHTHQLGINVFIKDLTIRPLIYLNHSLVYTNPSIVVDVSCKQDTFFAYIVKLMMRLLTKLSIREDTFCKVNVYI